MGRIDLVHNDPRFGAGQPRVALYPAAELCLRITVAVIQNSAATADIETGILIDGNPRGRRGLDIDQGNAVAGLQQGRLLAARSRRINRNAFCGGGRSRNNSRPQRQRKREGQDRE